MCRIIFRHIFLPLIKTNTMAEKYSLKERKRILSEYIELLVKNGYDIKWLMGKPLTYYNFDGVKKVIKDLQKELDNS